MSIFDNRLQTIDPEIYQAIEQEAQRQEDHIEQQYFRLAFLLFSSSCYSETPF